MKLHGIFILLTYLLFLPYFVHSEENHPGLKNYYEEMVEKRDKYLELLKNYQRVQGVSKAEVERAFQGYIKAKEIYQAKKSSISSSSGSSGYTCAASGNKQDIRPGNYAKAKKSFSFTEAFSSLWTKVKNFISSLFKRKGQPQFFKEDVYAQVSAQKSLNLRNMPGTEGKILDVMPHGAKIKALGRVGDWIIVDYNGIVGYAHGSYLKRISPPGSGSDDGNISMSDAPDDQDSIPDSGNPITYPKGSVNTHNRKFKSWLNEAKAQSDRLNQYFPGSLKNKYGQNITKDMVVKSILFSESRGVHSTPLGGVIQNKWGFTGWMQISKTVAKETLGENHEKWKDPKWNLIAGTKYIGTCLRSSNPPPASWKIYQPGDSKNDQLIKGIVGYNRGPYHKRMKKSWKEIVRTTKPSSSDYMAEGVNYGLQSKMGMGMPLTTAEKDWLIKYSSRLNSYADVDKRAMHLFNYVRNM
ncbi:SH3 domain-containing protein [Candidatus Riflebacteria bacterium]